VRFKKDSCRCAGLIEHEVKLCKIRVRPNIEMKDIDRTALAYPVCMLAPISEKNAARIQNFDRSKLEPLRPDPRFPVCRVRS
jgi:hypothetical protein